MSNCAGYLGTPTPTGKVSLIRMPHVATYLDTDDVTSSTPYVQNEADFISFTQYGSAIGVYRPGTPFTPAWGTPSSRSTRAAARRSSSGRAT